MNVRRRFRRPVQQTIYESCLRAGNAADLRALCFNDSIVEAFSRGLSGDHLRDTPAGSIQRAAYAAGIDCRKARAS